LRKYPEGLNAVEMEEKSKIPAATIKNYGKMAIEKGYVFKRKMSSSNYYILEKKWFNQ